MSQEEPKEKLFVPFNCPYCLVDVQMGDRHAYAIEKRALRGKPTITVKCDLVRTFAVALEPVDKPVEGNR